MPLGSNIAGSWIGRPVRDILDQRMYAPDTLGSRVTHDAV